MEPHPASSVFRVDVPRVLGNAELAEHVDALGGKGLLEFNPIDLLQHQAEKQALLRWPIARASLYNQPARSVERLVPPQNPA
jgi:hypothetical protein